MQQQRLFFKTANTGLATIVTGNTALDGTGYTMQVIVGASNGTMVNSIKIKAAVPVTKGMIRLFIVNSRSTSLYKEIPIPTTPATPNTPTPVVVLKTFEMELTGELKLQRGDALSVSTQNSESFNIIADGLDCKYPALMQTSGYNLESCCNFKQETFSNGLGSVAIANHSLKGGTLGVDIISIFTAGAVLPTANGSFIKTKTIKALQSTNPGMLRLFVFDGTNFYLYKEITVPETTQSGFDPSMKVVLEENFNLQTRYQICATTQIGQGFAFTVEGYDWTYPIS